MKKQNKTVAALMMALAMGFGAQTTVSAQFGGLMNKAKSAVKDKVDNKVSDLYDLVNSVARDVSWVKGRMEGDK